MVNYAPGFDKHPLVINGYSDFNEVLTKLVSCSEYRLISKDLNRFYIT
jgi:hypothetical protein